MLVTPVRLDLRLTRELEVEVRRAPRRARRAREDHAQDVGGRDLIDERAEMQKLGCGARRVPGAHVGGGCVRETAVGLERLRLLVRPQEIPPDGVDVVAAGLHAHQQAVEAGDVDPGRVQARLERLDERRPRAGERVEHVPAAGDVAIEERLDELGHELAEVRVEAMDVLRPLPLRQVRLRPRERQVEPAVQGLLCRGHRSVFDARRRGPGSPLPGTTLVTDHHERRPWRDRYR